MPVTLQGDLPVTAAEAEQLWQAVIQRRSFADENVTVRVVAEAESQRLKREYKAVNEPTNVLTFSYPGEHDVALCLVVAQREATAHRYPLRDYVAWLLTHAFLHATGMDHEVSGAAAAAMAATEQAVLEVNNFRPTT